MHRSSLQGKLIQWGFWPLLLVVCSPIFRHGHFPALDSPALLYNAEVWSRLLAGDPHLSEYFSINSYPPPYLLSHALYATLRIIMSPWATEVVLFLMFAISLPISFRWVVRSVNQRSTPLEWLGLLLMYNMPMRMGFLNYCFGLVLVVLAIGYLLRSEKRSIREVSILLFLWSTLLYFTHLFMLGLGLSLIMAVVLWKWWLDRSSWSVRKVWMYGLAVLPALSLATGFMLRSSGSGDNDVVSISSMELFRSIVELSPLVTLTYEPQVPYTRALFWTFLLMTVVVLILRFQTKKGVIQADVLGLLSIVMCLLLFVIPDQVVGMSWISARIILVAILLWMLWLAVSLAWRWWDRMFMLAVFVAGGGLIVEQDRLARDLSADAEHFWEASNVVNEPAVILPINYSSNWMHANFSNYLGLEHGHVVLDNVHALAAHGPVRLRDPEVLAAFGNNVTSLRPCMDLGSIVERSMPMVDVVCVWRAVEAKEDSCAMDLQRRLMDVADTVGGHPSEYLQLMQVQR